jgi:hypothetical protein
MRTHILMAAALTTAALAFTACGADSGAGGDSAADSEKQARDAQLKFARCMREHGVPMEDPKPGERGIRLMQPKGMSPEKMREADEACQKYLEDVRGPELSEEQQKEFQEAALAHSQCMRDHGLDFPDPTFDENGGAQIHMRAGSGLNPDSPKFQEAQKACESKLPKLDGEGPDGGPSTDEATP